MTVSCNNYYNRYIPLYTLNGCLDFSKEILKKFYISLTAYFLKEESNIIHVIIIGLYIIYVIGGIIPKEIRETKEIILLFDSNYQITIAGSRDSE